MQTPSHGNKHKRQKLATFSPGSPNKLGVRSSSGAHRVDLFSPGSTKDDEYVKQDLSALTTVNTTSSKSRQTSHLGHDTQFAACDSRIRSYMHEVLASNDESDIIEICERVKAIMYRKISIPADIINLLVNRMLHKRTKMRVSTHVFRTLRVLQAIDKSVYVPNPKDWRYWMGNLRSIRALAEKTAGEAQKSSSSSSSKRYDLTSEKGKKKKKKKEGNAKKTAKAKNKGRGSSRISKLKQLEDDEALAKQIQEELNAETDEGEDDEHDDNDDDMLNDIDEEDEESDEEKEEEEEEVQSETDALQKASMSFKFFVSVLLDDYLLVREMKYPLRESLFARLLRTDVMETISESKKKKKLDDKAVNQKIFAEMEAMQEQLLAIGDLFGLDKLQDQAKDDSMRKLEHVAYDIRRTAQTFNAMIAQFDKRSLQLEKKKDPVVVK